VTRRYLLIAAQLSVGAMACELALTVHETPSTADAASVIDAGASDVVEGGDGSREGLLFASGFENGVTLGAPHDCAAGNCQQDIGGGDLPGFAWPISVWQSHSQIQLLAGPGLSGVTTQTIADYMTNEIVSVQGRGGGSTMALHQKVIKVSPQITLDGYNLDIPSTGANALTQGEFYVSHYMQIAGDVAAQLGPSAYRQVFQLFQSGAGWLVLTLSTDGSDKLFWQLSRRYEGAALDWDEQKFDVPIPSGWFRLETFWRPGTGSDGRVWVAVNDQRILSHDGQNLATPDRITTIQILVNSPSRSSGEQWVDDVEIWDRAPSPSNRLFH
jgi:hypothetical protein